MVPARPGRCEDPFQRWTGDGPMDDVVPELRELVEDEVPFVPGEEMAGVVYLLDVAFRSRRAVDVARIVHPLLEPAETLPAHALGQHCNGPASEEPRDRHAPAAVVAGRGPDGAVARDVERSGHEARNKAAVCGEHLVGADHREPVAERHDELRPHPGQRLGQHEVLGDIDQRGSVRAVVPVDAKEVTGVGTVGIYPGDLLDLCREARRRIGELSDARELYAERPQVSDVPFVAVPVDDPALESWRHFRSLQVASSPCREAVPAKWILGGARVEFIISGDERGSQRTNLRGRAQAGEDAPNGSRELRQDIARGVDGPVTGGRGRLGAGRRDGRVDDSAGGREGGAQVGVAVVSAGARGIADALRILSRGETIDYEGASGSMEWDGNGDLRSGHIGIWRSTEDERIEEVDAVPFEPRSQG